jgi:hypothetical protein
MKKLAYKLRPTAGFSSVLHILFNALLPIAILFFVRLGFEWIAVAVVLLAKWRTVAVRPRYWIPNVRSNLVDIFVGLSVVAFMSGTTTFVTQIFWTVAYIVWLVWLKPKSNPVAVMTQALIAQAVTLVAFYRAFPHQAFAGYRAVFFFDLPAREFPNTIAARMTDHQFPLLIGEKDRHC